MRIGLQQIANPPTECNLHPVQDSVRRPHSIPNLASRCVPAMASGRSKTVMSKFGAWPDPNIDLVLAVFHRLKLLS